MGLRMLPSLQVLRAGINIFANPDNIDVYIIDTGVNEEVYLLGEKVKSTLGPNKDNTDAYGHN